MNVKRFTIYCLILLCTVFGSCKKFLAEYSQDEIRPTTTADLSALMYSDAYPYNVPFDTFDMLTDDVLCNGAAKGYQDVPVGTYVTALQDGMAMFKFDPMMFEAQSIIPTGADVYSSYYNKIKGCNVVIDYLDKVSGTETEKNAILGQCLFLRAFYYLKLVTTYGLPYSGDGVNPETNLGVPLVISSQVKDGGLKRNTLKEVYDQIEVDLLKSTDLLNANFEPPSSFRVGAPTANALLSRFYLYRGLNSDWDKSIDYANRVLAIRSSLTQMSTFFSTGNFVSQGIYLSTSPEVLWGYGSSTTINSKPYFPDNMGYYPPYAVSTSLSSLYDRGNGTGSTYEGDLRYRSYFITYFNGNEFLYKANKAPQNASYGGKGLRVAEVYLNRAEAYVKRFVQSGNLADRTAALADLNQLRRSRFDTRNVAYAPVEITDGNELFKFCQDERRRELCLEDGHRWVDIKRWGLSVTHNFIGTDDSSTQHILPANSPLYALPIPYFAFLSNPDLVQNPK
ncbi:RagB/SusD family nutrient uptake outer membrane protein [Pedobacter sp. AW31-3R]|uniref:RagB/SusD family nutrient uptake outer membrane protein n=1 Tax=Pedobacter sp. AW31-3R TaxID=3445781 RepID=UPI003FA01DC1